MNSISDQPAPHCCWLSPRRPHNHPTETALANSSFNDGRTCSNALFNPIVKPLRQSSPTATGYHAFRLPSATLNLSHYFRSLAVKLALCVGLGAVSTNALGANQIDITTYVPAASASGGYVSSLRVINKGSIATPVNVTLIDGPSGMAGVTGTLTTSLSAQAAVTFTAQQVEAALSVTLAATDRPRIRVTANAPIEAQSFLLQPGGVFSEVSDALGGASTVIVRSYVPATTAPSGYVSYLRVVNTGAVATPVTVARIDPVTGQTGAAGTLNASLPAGAAITYSATQVEAALGSPIAAGERPRIKVTGASSTLDVQTFLLQPNGAFTNHSSGKTGYTIDVSNYVPAAVNGYTSFIRVVNEGSAAAQVNVAMIDDVTGVAGTSAVLIPSLSAGAATTLTSSQVETALGVSIPASARPRIRISSQATVNFTFPPMLTVQSFLLQPGGAFNEISNVSSGTSVDVRSYIPAADAGTGYTSYLRVINTGVSATPVMVAAIDGTTGTVGNTGTLIASLPAGGAKTLTPSQVEAALGAQIAAGSRPRIRITGNTVLEVQSYLIQPGGAFTEMSGGQAGSAIPGSVTIKIPGLMGGAIQNRNVGSPTNVTTLAGGAGAPCGPAPCGATDGAGTAASFFQPNGITTDGTNLYVADSGNNKIRKIVIATGAVTTLAGSGAIGQADGTGTAASFNGPWDITTDGTNLYVSELNNHKIRKIMIATGVVTTLAGGGGGGNCGNTPGAINCGAKDGVGTAASFKQPTGITTDGVNLYVVDSTNFKIRKIVIATGAVTTLAGSGAIGAADGIGVAASFSQMNGITTDGTNLYVADSGNFKIRQIVIATGAVYTLFDLKLNVPLNYWPIPLGVTTDGVNLYVATYDAVYKISFGGLSGTFLAGKLQTTGLSPVNGIGAAAMFYQPHGITTDGTSLYVADSLFHLIRKIVVVPPTITAVNPSTGVVGSSVTITGTGFDMTPANNTIAFNGTPATVTAATATSLTVIVPAGATTGTVSVTTSGGTVTSAGSFTISAIAITGMNPSTGIMGTSVTITGIGFDITPANNTVTFNGTPATVTAATATSLTVTVPVSATTGTVSVTTPKGTATAGSFTVPSGGPIIYSAPGAAVYFPPPQNYMDLPTLASYLQSYYPGIVDSVTLSNLATYTLSEKQLFPGVTDTNSVWDGLWTTYFKPSGMCRMMNGNLVNQVCSAYAPWATTATLYGTTQHSGTTPTSNSVGWAAMLNGTNAPPVAVNNGNLRVSYGFKQPTMPGIYPFALIIEGTAVLNGLPIYDNLSIYYGSVSLKAIGGKIRFSTCTPIAVSYKQVILRLFSGYVQAGGSPTTREGTHQDYDATFTPNTAVQGCLP